MPKLVYTGLGSMVFRLNNRGETIIFSENNDFMVNVDRDTAYKIIRDKDKGMEVRFAQDPKAQVKKSVLGYRNKMNVEQKKDEIVRVKMGSEVGSIGVRNLMVLTKDQVESQGYDWEHAKLYAELKVIENNTVEKVETVVEKKPEEVKKATKEKKKQSKTKKNNDEKSVDKLKNIFKLESGIDVKSNLSG